MSTRLRKREIWPKTGYELEIERDHPRWIPYLQIPYIRVPLSYLQSFAVPEGCTVSLSGSNRHVRPRR
jgi:hypothetical protein